MTVKIEFWRKLVFLVGDIRKLRTFPWVTWSKNEHQINYQEVLQALPLIKYGDIGLHRDSGYLSNIAIPRFMKHAWIHIQDGIKEPEIVEAISEGVVQRSSIYPIFSDYAIILSPKEVTDSERKGACKKAKGVIGAHYDADFKFNVEEELEYYTGTRKDEAEQDLIQAQDYLQLYDKAFSCTELVSYAWWHKREQLRLFRKEYRGRKMIIADGFLNGGWEIKWMSRSVTIEAAQEMGLDEEGLYMIENFLKEQN